MAEAHEKAKLDYLEGLKYQEIADKYGVSLSTVKSWKTRYKWERKSTHTKSEKVRIQTVRTKQKKVCTKKSTGESARGAPRGNKNAIGNQGGNGPPKGSKNAATHNIYSTIISDELGEEEAKLFDAMANVAGLEHELQVARYKLARLLREQKLREMQGVMGGPDGADSYRLKDDFYENAILKAADVVRKMEAQLHKESIDLEKLKIEKKRLLILETKDKVLDKPSVQPYIDALTGNMEGVWDDE